jgi:phosphatidate cytidylyltransferase
VTRVLSAGVALVVLIPFVRYGSPVSFSLLVAAAAAVGTWEFLRLAGFPGNRIALGLGAAAGAALAFGIPHFPPPAATLVVWAALLLFFSSALCLPRHVWPAPKGIPGGILGIGFVGFTFGSMTLLRSFPEGGDGAEGWRWIFFLWLVVWAGDTGAYYGGRAWGSRPLHARLSPKKTVEGALAGMGASLAAGILAWAWFLPARPEWGWLGAGAVGLLLGAAGQAGDLAESAIKRAAGVKDAGALIPGHGGMLDRLDALMFAGPILYAILWMRGIP